MQAEAVALRGAAARAAGAAATWPEVRGHVLSARVLERQGLDGRPLFVAEVRYLYNVHARTRQGCWTGAPLSSRSAAERLAGRYTVGTKPWVAYNPANPTETTLGQGSLAGLTAALRRLFARAGSSSCGGADPRMAG